MSVAPTTEVTQLLYGAAPQINFAQIVAKLCKVLAPTLGTSPTLTWDCDDIAMLDFEKARVVVGFSDNLPGMHSACVTIATSQSLIGKASAATRESLLELCQTIAERLERRFPSDAQQTRTLHHALTPDLIDSVVDALFEQEHSAPQPVIEANPLTQKPAVGPADTNAEPSDMERLMFRLSTELTTRAPGLITRAIATATQKGRDALDRTDPTKDASRPQSPARTTTIGGLFWRKGEKASRGSSLAEEMSAPTPRKAAAKNELQAVRDALYAQDMARGSGVGQIAAQTKHALQMLTLIPERLASSVANKRQGGTQRGRDQVKN